MRAGDLAEEAERREQEQKLQPPPNFLFPPVPPPPGTGLLPIPFPPTKVGPMTMEDLHLRRDRRGGYHGQRPGYDFTIGPDGAVDFHDERGIRITAFALLGVAGVFDLTDFVMRMHGADPYSFDKGRVLELTGALREGMATTDRSRRIADAMGRLPGELEALWRRPDLGPAARRELLFGLWDEMIENRGDTAAEAAARARGEIVRFIHRTLPEGSPAAFTRAELVRMNATRRAREPFTPYAE